VYKGRKKKSIEYYAIKSVEKSQKTKVLQEVKEKHSEVHCYPSGNGEGAL
jgi:serine/threonine-protein kinase ULK4